MLKDHSINEIGVWKFGFGICFFELYNITEKEVMIKVNETMSGGRFLIKIDEKNFISGVYFYKITTGNFSTVKKLILIE